MEIFCIIIIFILFTAFTLCVSVLIITSFVNSSYTCAYLYAKFFDKKIGRSYKYIMSNKDKWMFVKHDNYIKMLCEFENPGISFGAPYEFDPNTIYITEDAVYTNDKLLLTDNKVTIKLFENICK